MAGYICRRCAYTPRITRLFDDVEDMPGDEINQFVIEHMDNNNVRYGEDAFEGSVVYRMVYCNNCNIRLGRYFVLIPREAEDEMFEYLAEHHFISPRKLLYIDQFDAEQQIKYYYPENHAREYSFLEPLLDSPPASALDDVINHSQPRPHGAVQENGFHYPVPNLIQVPDGVLPRPRLRLLKLLSLQFEPVD